MKVACTFCGRPVDPQAEGEYAQVTGWSQNRQKGTNQVAMRKETGRYAHGGCVKLTIRGIDAGRQESLI